MKLQPPPPDTAIQPAPDVTPTVWRDRIVGKGYESPDQLLAHPFNARIHTQSQEQALGAMLDEIGFVRSVLVNARTGFVVDGHLRVAHAITRGETAVPVEYVDLDESEEAIVLASLDAIAAMAAVDKDKLADLLARAKPKTDGARDALEKIAAKGGARGANDKDEDSNVIDSDTAMQALQAKYQTALGQVWAIESADGARVHRIVCGDATNAEHVARALAGMPTPLLMVTDPPYGVNYDASWREEYDGHDRAATGLVLNDDRVDWTDVYRLSPCNVAYVWHGGVAVGEFARNLEAVGFEIRSQIIWNKQAFIFSRGHYHWKHEPCWHAVKKGANANWQGSRKESTVWDIDSPSSGGNGNNPENEQTGHGTQKPVECMRRPIVNHTSVGDTVYEPFSGSGTTIAAAESCGRVCIAIELSPVYVAVALERMAVRYGCTVRKISDYPSA